MTLILYVLSESPPRSPLCLRTAGFDSWPKPMLGEDSPLENAQRLAFRLRVPGRTK